MPDPFEFQGTRFVPFPAQRAYFGAERHGEETLLVFVAMDYDGAPVRGPDGTPLVGYLTSLHPPADWLPAVNASLGTAFSLEDFDTA